MASHFTHHGEGYKNQDLGEMFHTEADGRVKTGVQGYIA